MAKVRLEKYVFGMSERNINKSVFIEVSVSRQDSPCCSSQVLFPHNEQASGFRMGYIRIV